MNIEYHPVLPREGRVIYVVKLKMNRALCNRVYIYMKSLNSKTDKRQFQSF